jgi:hypothetical protein
VSGFDGDVDEMPVPPLDDRALEALLRGATPAQPDFDWLVPFVRDLGAVASGSAPALQPALATLLADGFATEKGDLPAAAAITVIGPAPRPARLPTSRRRTTERFAGVLARLAGLGLAAKAGMGIAVAAASVTGAGAAGVLPAPAQHAVATVVASATPFTFPDSANAHAKPGAKVSTDGTGAPGGTHAVDGTVASDGGTAQAGTDPVVTGAGADPAVAGLDRANQTPAAGHVRTSLPAAAGDASHQGSGPQVSAGRGTAGSTPAAGRVPTSLPAAAGGGAASPGSTGLNRAGTTPAAGHLPANGPGRP